MNQSVWPPLHSAIDEEEDCDYATQHLEPFENGKFGGE